MTIKEWCLNNTDIINREEIQKIEYVLEAVRKLEDMPECIRQDHIIKNEKRLNDLKNKPAISGIQGNSSNLATNLMLNEKLSSIRYVRKSKASKKQYLILNNNIWLIPFKKCYILKKDSRSYVTDYLEVI